MTNIWDYIYTDALKIMPNEHSVLLIESVSDNKMRENAVQIFFERYNIPCYYVAFATVLSLYASGRTTGMVFDMGHDKLNVVAIYEGYALPHTLTTIENCGGHNLIKTMHKLISKRENTLPSYDPTSRLVYDLRNLAKNCFVAPNSVNYSTEKTLQFKLPDGKYIKLQNELWQSAESLFSQELFESVNSLFKSVEDPQTQWNNVILVGGCSLLEGFVDRFNNELLAIKPKQYPLTLLAPPERKYSPWIGGSILASLSTFQKMWISTYEYDESGPGIVHRKCF